MGRPSKKITFGERVLSSKVAMVLIAAVVAVAALGTFDAVSSWGKAYGNVTVNGLSVAGMTADEMRDALQGEFGPRVSHAQVTIYADDEAAARGEQDLSEQERRAIAEQISTEEAVATIGSWATDALSLKAAVPYDRAVEEALAIGREDGGLPARLGLVFGARDVSLEVQFDDEQLESLAADIDRTIGDPRVDSTVVVEGAEARVVEGHDGMMVDRRWLASMISQAMISGDVPDSFVAITSSAPSRVGADQAQEMADAVERAISQGAVFYYGGRSWFAKPADLGDWTRVDVAGGDGSWHLEASIDAASAVPAVVKGAGASITSEDMSVTFEKAPAGIVVHTAGTGNIPEVAPAISDLNDQLYGEGGRAWGAAAGGAAEVVISESDRPESLTFDQALELGVITAIGEYTTEFSNQDGTENRNHNIKLAADILTDAVIDANGGVWNFNERSGDTNEEAGFWTAGSIVDGEFVDSVGGGICQVATTIFNAVYEAGLDVVERHNHTLYIASYPTGRDAAVSYPDLDFIWENDLESDILMKLGCTDTSITAQLFSVYTGYSAETETGEWEEGERYGTRFERDDTLGSGAYYLKTVGEDGSEISITRTVYDEDDQVVRMDAFASVYAAKDQVYVIGPDVDTGKLGRTDSAGADSYDDYGYGEGSWY